MALSKCLMALSKPSKLRLFHSRRPTRYCSCASGLVVAFRDNCCVSEATRPPFNSVANSVAIWFCKSMNWLISLSNTPLQLTSSVLESIVRMLTCTLPPPVCIVPVTIVPTRSAWPISLGDWSVFLNFSADSFAITVRLSNGCNLLVSVETRP